MGSSVEQKVKEIICEQLGLSEDEVTPDPSGSPGQIPSEEALDHGEQDKADEERPGNVAHHHERRTRAREPDGIETRPSRGTEVAHRAGDEITHGAHHP